MTILDNELIDGVTVRELALLALVLIAGWQVFWTLWHSRRGRSYCGAPNKSAPGRCQRARLADGGCGIHDASWPARDLTLSIGGAVVLIALIWNFEALVDAFAAFIEDVASS